MDAWAVRARTAEAAVRAATRANAMQGATDTGDAKSAIRVANDVGAGVADKFRVLFQISDKFLAFFLLFGFKIIQSFEFVGMFFDKVFAVLAQKFHGCSIFTHENHLLRYMYLLYHRR